MAGNAKKSTRGNRYTPRQKAEVLAYVDAVNAEKGRGGAAAASRKYNISQITIGHWVKKLAEPTLDDLKDEGTISSADLTRKLKRLARVHEAIAKTEAELTALKSEYAELKASL